jgi:hypothetical protein
VKKTYDFSKEKKMFQARIVAQQKKAMRADRKNEQEAMLKRRRRRPNAPKLCS